jgi:hypothetical protein
MAGLGDRPVVLSAICVSLSVVVLGSSALEHRIQWRLPRLRPGRARPLELRRAYRDPAVQLRRDMLLGPFRGWWPLLVALLATDAATIVLALNGTISPVVRYGAASGLWGGVWATVLFRPLGIPLIGRSGRTVGGGEKSGTYLAAWSVRPVRPASVLRMIYLHGLVLGVGMTVFGLAHMWMTTSLGVGMELSFQGRFLLAMFAASPCVSGFLVATAVGRPLVGAVSFLAGVAVLPTQLFFMVSRWWRYLDISDESRAAVHLGVLVLLAAIGGLPPLRYLRVGASARPANPKKGQAHA